VNETLELFAEAALAAAGAGAVGAISLYAARRRSIAVQSALVALTPLVAVGAGALAASHLMLASKHPTASLAVVLASAGTVGIFVSLLLGARLRAGSERLIVAARRIGAGDLRTVIERPPTEELAALARELGEMQTRLEQSRTRERELEEARRELVAWISHDLRTPLARIRAIVEALEDDLVDTEEVVAYHARLRAETERLAALIRDLFELNRISAQGLELELEPIPLTDLVSDVVASFAVLADARGVVLDARRPSVDPEVEASPRHLERALGNLLDNALRYTKTGGVVEVEVTADDERACVTVDDSCGGIEPAVLLDFTDRNGRPRGEHAGQSGLGLAIARGLVEAQGGDISLESTERGCRFAVALPLAATARAGRGVNTSAGGSSRSSVSADTLAPSATAAAASSAAGGEALNA
jgi:signal transduction histidine kinase